MRLLLVLCAALSLAGCSTLHAYPGPKRAQGQVAVIRPARELHRIVYIDRVDGARVGVLDERVAVLPGEHRLVATAVLFVAERYVAATRSLRVEVEPGREYTVHGGWGHYGPRIWVRDAQTLEPIAEALTRPNRLHHVGTTHH